MRILSVTAQKPDSTGSGVYLSGLVNAFNNERTQQAVVAGIYREDNVCLPDEVGFYPVYFKEGTVSFPIPGMSDEMPYESTLYSRMTEDMISRWKAAFMNVLKEAVQTFQPDIILCHHLYLLTAMVRAQFPEHKVYGICHGTGLRQMQKHCMEAAFIRRQIGRLDRIYVLHAEQKQAVSTVYGTDPKKTDIIGSGFDHTIFHTGKVDKQKCRKQVVFAGKLSQKKGVKSLIRAVSFLRGRVDNIELILAGGAGDQEEYKEIRRLAGECPCEVHFTGRLTQKELAEVFRGGDVFVLPSFYEGLPLVLIEAMACGLQVVCTDLPGVAEWMEQRVPGNGIHYVTLPAIRNTDEAVVEELPAFEKRLAGKIETALKCDKTEVRDLSSLSWHGIAEMLQQQFQSDLS